jgi:hypothetical protein
MKLIAIICLLLLLFTDSQAGTRMAPQGLVKTITTAGTAERITATTRLAGDLLIQAPEANTGRIIIGGSNVLMASENGIILDPGEAVGLENLFPTTNVEYYDLQEFWIDGENNADRAVFTLIAGFQ